MSDWVTTKSIALAKAAQQRERAEIMRAVPGLVITDEGRVVLPRKAAQRPKRWYCLLCDRWFMSRHDCPRCGAALERAH